MLTYLQSSEEAIPQAAQPVTLLQHLNDLDLDLDSDSDSDSGSGAQSAAQSAAQSPIQSPARSTTHEADSQASPSPSSPTPSYEIVHQAAGKGELPPPLHLALGLWFEKSGCTRAEYVRLREVMQLWKASPHGVSSDGDSDVSNNEILIPIQTLPLKLDTLKRQVRSHMPLLQLMRKPLTVIIEKQPSLPQGEKKAERQRIERQSWMYWYDPLDLIRNILAATHLRSKMHFGMAMYVDEPTELWHSNAWGSSIRSCSGEVTYSQAGALIIPGDIVKLRAAVPYRIGRVTFIGRDHRSGATGEVLLTVQAIAYRQAIVQNLDLDLSDEYEYFLLEDVLFELPAAAVDRHMNMYLDRDYGGYDDEIAFSDERKFIRKVINIRISTIRPLRQLHPTRGELEITHFGRDILEAVIVKSPLSFPYLLFIDDFGVHRNMYRALKAFYLIPACLSYDERRKLANVFTLSLGPHGADLNDVVEAFHRPLQQLDGATDLEVNGITTTIWAFAITLLGDMPQQADNAGFLRHTANMGCRTCFCPKDQRADLDFDIIDNGRYHWETIEQRRYAEGIDKAACKIFVRETGVRLDPSPITKLCPALDLVQSRAYDAPHSEWRGLGRVLQGFLMTTILTKRGAIAYLKMFQEFQFPPGWKRIQSPAHYIWSWSLSEAGRATILTPLILRSKATIGWFRLPYLQAAERIMPIRTTPLQAIVRAFGLIALSNTLVGSQRYTEPGSLHQHVLDARRAYQELITCASPAAEGFGNRVDDENSESSDDDDDDEAILDKGRKPKPLGSKFVKLLKLPNVHAGLHLAENAREYATVMNSNVLAGELKHKYTVYLYHIGTTTNSQF